MTVKITRTKEPVQPIAQDAGVLEQVGLAPKGGVTIIKKLVAFSVGSKIKITKEYPWVGCYKAGDTGTVLKKWDEPKEAAFGLFKKHDLDLYEVLLDNPREVGHELVFVRKHEIDSA